MLGAFLGLCKEIASHVKWKLGSAELRRVDPVTLRIRIDEERAREEKRNAEQLEGLKRAGPMSAQTMNVTMEMRTTTGTK